VPKHVASAALRNAGGLDVATDEFGQVIERQWFASVG
jgi:hypothetical protein